MRIGPLRKQLSMQSRSTAEDSYGQPTETFTEYKVVWGSINPVSGSEIISGQQQSGEITHKVNIRHNTSVVITDRVVFESRTFEIIFIRNVQERNHWQELLCKEVV
jgi:SPP1 family predicted phage head-tail adaptor